MSIFIKKVAGIDTKREEALSGAQFPALSALDVINEEPNNLIEETEQASPSHFK